MRGGPPLNGRFSGEDGYAAAYYALESMRLVKNRAMMAPMMAFQPSREARTGMDLAPEIARRISLIHSSPPSG